MKATKKETIQKSYDPLEVGLPSSMWVEEMILGIVMTFPERMEEISPLVTVEDFSSEANRLVWMACFAIWERNVPPALHVVATELQEYGQLEASGGVTRLFGLCEPSNCPNIPGIVKYIAVLRDFSARRKLIFKANELLIQASLPRCDIASLLMDGADSLVKFSSELSPTAEFKSPMDILKEAGGLHAYGSQPSADRIVTTPFVTLNRYLQMGGFIAGDLVIIAGHTSRGKSALAVNIALHAVVNQKRVALVSLEMPEGSIFDRLVSLTGQIDGYSLHRENANPIMEDNRRKAIRDSVYAVTNLPIAISYRPGVSTKRLTSDLKRFKAVGGLDLVIVDYLQLMSGTVRNGGTRAEEVGGISRALKQMAGDLAVPVIALSQFNRDSSKGEREPEIYDLKESGSIEQDASLVLLMHVTRPWDMGAGIETGEIKLKLAKQRNGSVTWLPLNFHAPTGTFSEPGSSFA